MPTALGVIGLVAILAAVVMFVIALVRKKGWGIARSFVLGVVGFILVIVGTAIGIGEEMGKPETITPATPPMNGAAVGCRSTSAYTATAHST